MTKSGPIKRAIFLLAVGLIWGTQALQTPVASAAPPGAVVINEVMYNPANDNQDEEFLELYNTTSSSINLEGWCFTSGINLCFGAGISIAQHGYLLISPDSAQSIASYVLAPSAVYTGNLSNGGETLTLKDELGAIADEITYDDSPPWPTPPDGNGSSLELKDPGLDNSLASSWGSSNPSPTPLADNSLANTTTPSLSEISVPTNVQPGQTQHITAKAENASVVELTYKVMFNSEVVVAMLDDGAHSDGAAGDDVYGADIPGQAVGTLVRFKITAENISGTVSHPAIGESINYLGYTVVKSDLSELPTFRWYMDPTEYEDMATNHLDDGQDFEVVISFGGQVYDNAKVNIKGTSNIYQPKKKYKFDMPQGYRIGAPYFSHPVDEFSLNNSLLSPFVLNEELAWRAARSAGMASPQTQLVDVELNSNSSPQAPLGMYLLTEGYDKSWRERNGYEQGAFYKESTEKKTRLNEDDSDIQDWIYNLENLTGEDLRKYILDNVDVHSAINHDATMAIMRSFDWTSHQNTYQYRDTAGTQRWSVQTHDLDVAMNPVYLEGYDWNYTNQTSPSRLLGGAMYQFPEFSEAFDRRTSELFEQIYGSETQDGLINDWLDEIYGQASASIDNEDDLWSAARVDNLSNEAKNYPIDPSIPGSFTTFGDLFLDFGSINSRNYYNFEINRERSVMANSRTLGLLPDLQPDNTEVVINELNYNPTGGNQHEFLEVYNPNDYAVDLSGWQIEGVNFVFPGGSVLPALSYGLIVKNDTAFRAHYGSGNFIMGQYSGSLANEGETITLKRVNGSSASRVSYQNGGEWSGDANGQGYTLGLIRTSADPSLAACWAPSLTIDGTPGAINTLNNDWLLTNQAGCTDSVAVGADGNSTGLASTGEGYRVIMTGGIVLIAVASVALINRKLYLQ